MSGYIGLSPTTLKNLSGATQVVHNDTADYVLANDALTLNPNILIGGALTAPRNVIVPVTVSTYIIQNATTGGFAIIVKTPTGTGVTIPPGATSLVRPNGTNVIGVYHPGDPGSPFSATTAAAGTDTTQVATTAYATALGLTKALLAGSATQAFSASDLTASGVINATGNVNLKTTVALADAAATLTAAQLANSGIFTITPTVARILTTDTAANIVAALPQYRVGTWFDFTIVNLAAFDITLAAGVGITLVGKMIVNNASGTWKARIDSATAVTISSAAVAAVDVASTAEAVAGTNNTKAITPLRMREGFNAPGNAPVFACRAWVNFSGVGTVTIRVGGNVSSISDNGVGDYTVNFTTAMPDANYAPTFGAPVAGDLTKGTVGVAGGYDTGVTLKSTTQLRIHTGNANGIALVDFSEVYVAIFR